MRDDQTVLAKLVSISVSSSSREMAVDCHARGFGERGKDLELFLFILSLDYVHIP